MGVRKDTGLLKNTAAAVSCRFVDAFTAAVAAAADVNLIWCLQLGIHWYRRRRLKKHPVSTAEIISSVAGIVDGVVTLCNVTIIVVFMCKCYVLMFVWMHSFIKMLHP